MNDSIKVFKKKEEGKPEELFIGCTEKFMYVFE
jgi:hypothetical protein